MLHPVIHDKRCIVIDRGGTFFIMRIETFTYCRRLYGFRYDWEMIETFLDKKTDDSIRVEEEVASARVLVADDSEQGLELRGLREREDGRRE